MKSILFVSGTRPEYIKISSVVRLLNQTDWAEPYVVATGQHTRLVNELAETLDIDVNVNLGAGKDNQTLSEIVARSLPPLQEVIREQRPAGVVVQGDAHSAMVGAVAAYYEQRPIAHIEAGLRTWDKYSPFPEEMNRIMIDAMADILFAPTAKAAAQLRDAPWQTVRVTGNTEIDTLYWMKDIGGGRMISIENLYPEGERLILATVHRRESFGDEMEGIFRALDTIAAEEGVTVLLPLHPNPNVLQAAERARMRHVTIGAPLCYGDMVYALQRAEIVLTDSGGVQEGASAFHKPTLVLREKTERMEGIEAGCAKLVGTSESRIVYECTKLLNDAEQYAAMAGVPCPYGDGTACEAIVETLKGEWGK